jgi:hypothetical protein
MEKQLVFTNETEEETLLKRAFHFQKKKKKDGGTISYAPKLIPSTVTLTSSRKN